jgi:cell wall assembly regulator SMI1
VKAKQIQSLVVGLDLAGVRLEPRLNHREIASAERQIGLNFPPDLRQLLEAFLPTGAGFPTWRNLEDERLARSLSAPAEGVIDDVRLGQFWLASWGSRSTQEEERVAIARQHVEAAPALIPLYGHRYLPSAPQREGNPVLSVVQTDVIVFATDVEDFFLREFAIMPPGHGPAPPHTDVHVPFWSDVIEENNRPLGS